ncbi:fasciclin domain-containing protein [Abyssalbus ytuae]|uniref:Fasciclin domain-containing protein n=1 Tax=Abyssalbus ytuae TaxID=2926907 RepID=A0A9E7CU96_9FLAO|nr:fasciclin domain-containing protein [Abyssalbus ytuae]UOB17982.1 fasciclin domain-containing protein [Abyssalbus ytuae]
MKILKKLNALFMISLTLMFFVSCSSDDDNNDTPPVTGDLTITETASADADLSTFTEALERTEMDATLDASGSYTVFAPTNQAFVDAGITNLDDYTDEELKNIVLNHVLDTKVTSGELTTGYVTTLAVGPNDENVSMYVNAEGGIELNGLASPVANNYDIEATNGVVHKVDAVLTVPNVIDQASVNSEFSLFVEALERFATTYKNQLSTQTDAAFTVFIPTNEAMEDLLLALGYENLAAVPDATLEAILAYHIIASSNMQSGDLTDGATAATLSSDQTLEIDLEGSVAQIVDASPFTTTIVESDIQAENGVIHVIDKVIIPEDVVTQLNGFSIAAYTLFDSEFSMFGEALMKAEHFATLRDREDLTAFIPTNASFEAFLEANGYASLDDVPADVLTQTVLYHVMGSVEEVEDFTTSYVETFAEEATTTNKLSMYVTNDTDLVINGGVDNGGATIVESDIVTSNGVIHVPDAVINLPTVVTFAKADATLTAFLAALTVENGFTFVETLSSADGDPDPFTVFAPTNEAFVSFLTELSITSLGDLPTTAIEGTLNTHVVTGENLLSADLTDAMTISTLGDDIVANITGGATLTDSHARVSSVVNSDIQAWNGVIHIVDKVMLTSDIDL